MSKVARISVAKDFAPRPGPRYKHQGPHSGQTFRESVLAPFLDQNEMLVVDLDGTAGYGSSFIDEAFGGLVRMGYDKEDLLRRIEVISKEDPILAKDAIQAIRDADPKQNSQ